MWREAALTPFVLKEGVGIAVGSLREIGAALQALTPEQYQTMCENAKAVSQKLANGYYFKAAFTSAIQKF